MLANLHRAVRSGGGLYLTVEEVDDSEIDRAYVEPTARGLPAVRGEIVEGNIAGYHYYPGRDRVIGLAPLPKACASSSRTRSRRTGGPTGTSSCARR